MDGVLSFMLCYFLPERDPGSLSNHDIYLVKNIAAGIFSISWKSDLVLDFKSLL
jgi:hypothetical protein